MYIHKRCINQKFTLFWLLVNVLRLFPSGASGQEANALPGESWARINPEVFLQTPRQVAGTPQELLAIANDYRNPFRKAAAYDLVKLGRVAVPSLLQDIRQNPPRDGFHHQPTVSMIVLATQGAESVERMIKELQLIQTRLSRKSYNAFLYSTVDVIRMSKVEGYSDFLQHVVDQFGVNPREPYQINYANDVGAWALYALLEQENPKNFKFLSHVISKSRDVYESGRIALYLAERGFRAFPVDLELWARRTHNAEFFVAALTGNSGNSLNALKSEWKAMLRQEQVRCLEELHRAQNLSVVPFLISLLGDKDESVAMASWTTLQRLTFQSFARDKSVWGSWWSRHQKEQRLDLLEQRLASFRDSPELDGEHASALGILLDRGEPIVVQLEPKWFYEKGLWAAHLWKIIATLPASRYHPRLLLRKLLAHVPAGSPHLGQALRLLGQFGDPSDRELLQKFLGHANPKVRFAAALSLLQVGDKAGVEIVINALTERHRSSTAASALENHLQTYFGGSDNWAALAKDPRLRYLKLMQANWRTWWCRHCSHARIYPIQFLDRHPEFWNL